jgi:glycosyltransferase involved in cell wall biosynthesis
LQNGTKNCGDEPQAIEFLTTIYDVPEEKIALIEHGVPDIHFNPEKSKKEFKLENKKVLLTFGFIGRSKGIETVIKALPEWLKNILMSFILFWGKPIPMYCGTPAKNTVFPFCALVKNLHLENMFVSE